ncbi:MAG: hypothetical protein CME06_04880 [Gemmatimonadetes bacterium]|nr:hypothetical protein [Gemmatimonadota bacterium]
MNFFHPDRRTFESAALRSISAASFLLLTTSWTARGASLGETVGAALAVADYLEAALIDPPESGADRWGVFDGFEIGADGYLGGYELPGSYAAAGRALLEAYRLGGDTDFLDEAEAVAT